MATASEGALEQGGRRLSRRALLRGALALGSLPCAAGLLAACGLEATTAVATNAAIPRPSPGTPATPSAAAQSVGTPGGTPESGATRTGVTESTITIGTWGPQDGPAGAYGAIGRTIVAYFARLNDEGGIGGRRVAVINENDSYQPTKTTAAVRKLVEGDGVFALVGGLGAQQNLAVLDYLIARGVPHIAPATGLGALARPTRPAIFCVQPSYATEATRLVRHALDTVGARTLAIFYQDDAAGREGHDAAQLELARRGLSPASAASYLTTDANAAAQASRLRASNAEAIILYAVPWAASSFIRELGRSGYRPALLASSLIADPGIFELVGPGIDGVITASWFPDLADTGNPNVAAFRAWMETSQPGSPSDPFAATGYAYATLLAELLRRTGSDLTRERFVRVANGLQGYSGSLIPSLSFAPDNHQGTTALALQRADAATKRFRQFGDFE